MDWDNMKQLQKLALLHIKKMAEELHSDAINLGTKLSHHKEEFDEREHAYPLADQASEIRRWTEAIIDSGKPEIK